MWATTPVHRWEMPGSWEEDAPPNLPEDVDRDGLLFTEDGAGPLLHRLYRTEIVAAAIDAGELLARLREDLDRVAPSEFATFQKLRGEGGLEKGDEYVVRMPGPWDGPVRAVAADRLSFRLATLEGHLEAGQIEFRASEGHRSIYFEIESWARSGDRLSNLLYTRLRISKEVQLHMWASVLRKVTELAEGRREGGIVITTRRVEPEQLPGVPAASEDGERDFEALRGRPLNFELDRLRAEAGAGAGSWQVDDMVERLPHEPPGAPTDRGSFQLAREIMDRYQLADPRVVEASYDRDGQLYGRDMLLRIRFGVLRFRVGVRVGEVYEETLEKDGREVRVFGWCYRTLAGHFEEGEMRYELWKWVDSGDVEFHLQAISRPARSGPLLPRLGFRLIGRIPQLRFYHQAGRRLRRLTEARLETQRAGVSARRLPERA